jgi:hypothetical protein
MEDTAYQEPVHPFFGRPDETPHPKSCYFWVDCREDEQYMAVMCEKCHDEKMPNVGWKWHGSRGFGPYDYVCEVCNRVIHQHETENGSKNDENPSDIQG